MNIGSKVSLIDQVTAAFEANRIVIIPPYTKLGVHSDDSVSRFDFNIEQKVLPVLTICVSDSFHDAVQISTPERTFHIVLSENFEKSKLEFYEKAKKEKVSAFWIAADIMRPGDGVDEDEMQSIICTSGLRKWIYCPLIELEYDAWQRTIKEDTTNRIQAPEHDCFIRATDLEFKLQSTELLFDYLSQIYGLEVDSVLKTKRSTINNVFESKVLLASLLIVFLQQKQDEYFIGDLMDAAIKLLPCNEKTKIFYIYHSKEFNWELKKFNKLKTALPRFQIRGLADFITTPDISDKQIEELEKRLIQPFLSILELIELLPFCSFIDSQKRVQVDTQSIIDNYCSVQIDWCPAGHLLNSTPDPIRCMTSQLLKQNLNELNKLKEQHIESGSRLKQCQSCHIVQINENSLCSYCKGEILLPILPESAKQYHYSLLDVSLALNKKVESE